MCHNFPCRADRIGKSFCAILVVSAIFVLFARQQASGQGMLRQYSPLDRYRYLPRLPQGNENPTPLPDTPRDATGSDKVLVEALKGLIILDSQADVVVGPIDHEGVEVRSGQLDLPNFDGFYETANSYLGRPVSLLSLNELSREIVILYRQNDQPVVDVNIPEQDITDGVVQIVVTEAHVGEVRVEGTTFFNPRKLVNQVYVTPGDRIYETELMEDLRWLIRNPFRDVRLKFSPGAYPGATDVVFDVYDKRPLRLYAGYEDTGNRVTGLERTIYGINWYNALGRDDQAGYQFTGSHNFTSLEAHSAYYSTALYNRDIISIYGAYGQFEAPVQQIFNNTGQTWAILARWYRELCPWGCYEHSVTAGFDYKSTNTNLEFGGIQAFQSAASVVQFMAGYSASREDDLGKWSFGIDGYFSPGDIGGSNTDEAFQQQRAFATANYAYARGFLERRTWLTCNFEFVARVTSQLSEGNLLSIEQLGYGGYNSIRGYDQYSVVGDSGYFANLELWTRPICVGLGDDELRFLAFYDFGDSYNHTLLPGEDPSVDLDGLGVGLRYVFRPNFELRADYAHRMADVFFPLPQSRWHIGAVVSH